MTKFNRLRGFTTAVLAASALFAAQPAAADIIEINNFWGGYGIATINFNGTDWHNGSHAVITNETGGSGGFLTYDLTTDPKRSNGFQSFCVDIFHSFGFTVDSNDTQQPATIISAQAAANLAQLYSNHLDDISATSGNSTNESAFQLAVWEIVNESNDNNYNLSAGAFRASGTGQSLAQSWLNELVPGAVSDYVANIWTVQSMITTGHGYAQDVVTFSPVAPVPEPQTYAMMLVGLGLLGFSARRKKQDVM